MIRTSLGRRCATIAAATAVVAGVIVPAPVATAASVYSRDVAYSQFMSTEALTGVFFTSDGDHSDVLYQSTDGKHFNELTYAYRDKYPADPASDVSTHGPIHHTLGDPSIMYHDGAFWMLSAWQRRDGRFWPTIGVSVDGKKWSYPEGLYFDGAKYPGIALQPHAQFGTDIVAPEWFRDDRGDVYIVFSAGYFGLFHGQPYQDRMVPYMVKVKNLSFNGYSKYDARLPKISFTPGVAKRINLNSHPTNNRIDGSCFQDDDGSYYFIVKRDGAYNEIWKNTSMRPTGWKRVQDGLAKGSEGPSLTKMNGRYYLYTDELHTWSKNGSRGTLVHSAPSITGPWKNMGRIVTLSKNGKFRPNRHGSVVNFNDTEAKKKLYTLWTGKQAPAGPGSLLDLIFNKNKNEAIIRFW